MIKLSIVCNGIPQEIMKDPITDSRKKSHKGLLALMKDENGKYYTKDQCTPEEEAGGELITIFEDGKLLQDYYLEDIRERAMGQLPI